ncbi:unnamed protein product [Clonostachys rosea f. rosea IK726]|uniref:Kinesin light chain n=2 Tax=Bionectria ochroleuca TaxID=29856 RepID=A0A0B7KJ32_BIOOC|nr:unnamed protein product [Clonostachys rosea f. rosea IK726]
MYNRALQGYEKAWGPEHTSTLGTVNNLGLLYYNQGRLKEAEEIVKTYPPALNTRENLADLLHGIGKTNEASKLWTQAAEGVQLVYGSTSEKRRRISIKLKESEDQVSVIINS